MTAENDFNFDFVDSPNDPLVTRLRALRMAEAPAEVRERCWQQLQARIAEGLLAEVEQPEISTERLRECDRFTFTVRLEPRRPTLADRWASMPSRPLAAAL
jgi:hypothetical protein